jgi:urocanate hydratase
LAPDPNLSAAFNLALPGFLLNVERFYASLISASHPGSEPEGEPGLGGQLFYAGELDPVGRALMVAANIAGAASLAATPDLDAQKQAVRDGVADFLVISLDEALRILKNQIRKRETVAVCVGAAPAAVNWEMLERGVLPDLVR